ncbi:APC family permease [Methanosarcina acetivorans]|uniref:Transmembrane protein n=1 Tax=Methanosarcina acetivorans (strain ATCC 35395 / DSM 2834 / JCM 12185 / C2A) TaxID=188937 RepID=Q8TP86_METAC|nr:APC family permease [Methanosarcina acetivorans]AAM05433.1 predicted protein [Methanosarcina acetivorans C2A]
MECCSLDFLGWENLSFCFGELRDPERNIPRLYWLSFVPVAAIYVLLTLISVGASTTGVSLKGAAGLSSLVLFIPGGSFLIWIIMDYNSSACSKCMFRELYCKPPDLCWRQDRCFSRTIRKVSKRHVPLPSLVALYVLSVPIITGCYLLKVPITAMMLLVNHNFIFLCSFVIITY